VRGIGEFRLPIRPRTPAVARHSSGK
jgi:hypothetical protein